MNARQPVAARRRSTRKFVWTIALLVCVAFLPQFAWGEPVRLGGTGAALATMRLIGDALRKDDPQFAFEIVPNLGSGGGLQALKRDAIHVAVISRALNKEEEAAGLRAFEYGKTPFVLATAKKNGPGVSLDQIAEIYSGKRATWVDGTPIRLVLRPANDSDTSALAAFSPAVKQALAHAHAREGLMIAVTDQDAADQIMRLPGGLGTASLSLILSEDRALLALPIDGVAASVQNLATGTYPYAKSMYLVVKGEPQGAPARFLQFVRSAKGRKILAATGHWTGDVSSPAK